MYISTGLYSTVKYTDPGQITDGVYMFAHYRNGVSCPYKQHGFCCSTNFNHFHATMIYSSVYI